MWRNCPNSAVLLGIFFSLPTILVLSLRPLKSKLKKLMVRISLNRSFRARTRDEFFSLFQTKKNTLRKFKKTTPFREKIQRDNPIPWSTYPISVAKEYYIDHCASISLITLITLFIDYSYRLRPRLDWELHLTSGPVCFTVRIYTFTFLCRTFLPLLLH